MPDDTRQRMPFLNYLDPASTDPAEIVNRDAMLKWLRASIESFLRAPDRSRGRAMALLGDRGIGKSILARKVFQDLREIHGADTLFLVVDCRQCPNERAVYEAIAWEAIQAIGFRSDRPLLDTARTLHVIASFDEVERTRLAELTKEYSHTLKLKGPKNLLALLGVSSEVRSSYKQQETVMGKVKFTAASLRQAVIAFFSDLHEHAGLDVVLLLDNLEEIQHDAILEEDHRTRYRGEIDSLLGLASAPIGLLITARTYFAGSLNRQIDSTKVLHRLSNDEHVALVRKRLDREPPEIRGQFDGDGCGECIDQLAGMASTPLSLLSWFKFLAENELHSGDPRAELERWLDDRYGNFDKRHIIAVVAAFAGDPSARVAEAVLLKACRENEAVWKQMVRYQVVLPIDFWDPHTFTLAPELHFLCFSGPASR